MLRVFLSRKYDLYVTEFSFSRSKIESQRENSRYFYEWLYRLAVLGISSDREGRF